MGCACFLLLLTLVNEGHSRQDEVPSASCAASRSPGCDKGLSMLAQRHRVTKKDLLEKVTLATSTHTLYYAPDFPDVGDMTKVTTEEVPAWTLENDRGVRVKVMRKGGNLVELSKDGHPYVWDNTKGAIYYGVNSSTFPLTRGLYINGGVRFAAVTPEHGLYYDTLWDVTFEQSEEEQSRSIILSITDSSEQRQKLNDTLSQGGYSLPDGAPMSAYPVTNLVFRFWITLRAGEDYVRLRAEVINPTAADAKGAAWMPMTFPIDEDSQIITPQVYRFKSDEWCYRDLPKIFRWDSRTELARPAQWKEMCIFYDYPQLLGGYHAVQIQPTSQGKGTAYVTLNSSTGLHFTKMWSWGKNQAPIWKDYYEPWESAFNSHFWQTFEFPAKTQHFFDIALVPIPGGLTGADQPTLQQQVSDHLVGLGFGFDKGCSTLN
ncbi:unnamed protein product [Symbiodinium sp. CCMP2456]|nr:unnamed protein product [Symbiodinium sp. CCMP2456]